MRRLSLRIVGWFVLVVFLVVGFSGCIGSESGQTKDTDKQQARRIAAARDPQSQEFKPVVVVAVIDTGVNVYHQEFEERYDLSDPADYIPGYPEDVIPLKISPFKSPVSTALRNREQADAAIWEKTEPRKLYRVEGTKIVGLISFGSALPGAGHGTMTSSRAVGNTISAGGADIRLVHVIGFTPEAVTWASSQPWIDILSISSGASSNVATPVTGTVLDGTVMKAFDAASHKKPFFASSGNGVTNGGVLGFPTWLRGASGVPDVISVGANDNGKLSLWHNFHPYIIGDGCGNPAASDASAETLNMGGGGTSSATPYSAGVAAKILLEARRILGDAHAGTRTVDTPVKSFGAWSSRYDGDAKVIMAQGNATNIAKGPLADGILTLQEFKDVLYHTARWDGSEEKSDGNACTTTASGTVPPGNLPRDAVAQYQGYGEVTAVTAELAVKVLLGEADNPSRPQDDAWYQHFHTLRTQTMPRN